MKRPPRDVALYMLGSLASACRRDQSAVATQAYEWALALVNSSVCK